jgi:hypothetical protein
VRAVYCGIDMRAGPGVDAVGSAHHLPVRAERAGTVLVLDTLEHVLDPVACMAQVRAAVRPGGAVIMTSHMNFPVHAHPGDYWRFTPMAFEALLRPLETRSVFMQGDAENPHTVIGVARRDDGDRAGHDGDRAGRERFAAALSTLQLRWPDDAFGGPLVPVEPCRADVGHRDGDFQIALPGAGAPLEQRVGCGADGLCRIDVRMACRSPSGKHVVFRVREAGDLGREIAVHRVAALHVPHDGWVAVPIARQRDSAGREYVLDVSTSDNDGDPDILLPSSAPAGELAGSLCFQAYCATESDSGDVQRGEDTLERAAPFDAPSDGGGISRQQWEQTRYLASSIVSAIDRMVEEQHAYGEEILRLQRATLDAATENLVARTLPRRVSRTWRRLRGRDAD